MKRFTWPLQRLLEVTAQRELALRAALSSLAQESAQVQQQIVSLRALLRGMLEDLAAQSLSQRLPRQEVFMTCSGHSERQIQQLQQKLQVLQQRRSEAVARLQQARSRRENMERRRQEAYQRHVRAQLKLEQDRFDESYHANFARKAIQKRGSTGFKPVPRETGV